MRAALIAFFLFSMAAAARLAWLPEHSSDSNRAALRKMLESNPRATGTRITLALLEEQAGDPPAAERDLLTAAGYDHQYLPAWTLANFYFRRDLPAPFWTWARRAAALNPDEPDPLLILCDRMSPGQALENLPENPRLDRAYLDLLTRGRRWTAARRVALRMIDRRDPEDLRRVTGFLTRLIEADQIPAAAQLWHRIAPHTSLPVDGDFHSAPSGQGFDWRLSSLPGVDPQWSPDQLAFRLSGREPESFPLLEQPIPDPGYYTLTFEYQCDFPGLRWTLGARESPELQPSAGWTRGDRTLPGSATASWLRLIYRRDPGNPRAEGQLHLRAIHLTHELTPELTHESTRE